MIKFLLIKIISMTLIFGCAQKGDDVIDIEEVLSDLREGRITSNQLEFDLSDCLYLDSSLKHSIDSLVPSYFTNKKFEPSKYEFDSEDGNKILLSSDYKVVSDLVVKPDPNFKRYLKDQFGFKKYKEDSTDVVLIYGEKAFIKFSNEFSSSGYIIELIEPNMINVLVAYVIVD